MRRAQLWLALAFSITAVSLLAQLPTARLSTVFPPGGKQGATIEVTITGNDLDDLTGMHFSHAGIAAKPKIGDDKGQPEANKFMVAIAANVPPGIYEARIVGRYGVSNPRAFAVGVLPEMIEKSPNNAPDTAMEISLETTINGRADANSMDYFKFAAKKGQRLLVEYSAREIDSRMEPALIVNDASGREVERTRRGGVLDFTAPADGQYLLKVHDFTFRGGPEYFYRLTISAGPHLDFIFPPSGLPGTKGKYVLYGRNLPGGTPAQDLAIDGKPLEQLTVEIELPSDPLSSPRGYLLNPGEALVDGIEYRVNTPQGSSNPLFLSFATAPVVAEQEPNDKPAQAQKISLPCEYAGRLYPARDQDWLTFEAKKGEVYWVEIFSQRLGLPTDPFLLVQRVTKNDQGEPQAADLQELNDSDANIGGTEFKTSTLDPAWRFEVKEDGDYRIEVRDLFNQTRNDPRLVYRLSLRKEKPDFRLVAVPVAPSTKKDSKEILIWTPFLRPGETMPVKVLALRRDNFTGEIRLNAEDLPPGVSCSEARIESGKNSALLLLTAAEDAAGWVGPLKIVGRGKAGETELAREARGGVVTWNVNDPANEAVQSRLTRNCLLAVADRETAPITLEVAERKVWEAPAGGKFKIPFTVVRRGEFTESLKLKATGIPALDSLKELDVDGKATNVTLEINLAQQKIPAGTHTFYLQTQTKGKYVKTTETLKSGSAASKQDDKKDKPKPQGKDVTFVVYSTPVTIKVLPEEKKEKQ